MLLTLTLVVSASSGFDYFCWFNSFIDLSFHVQLISRTSFYVSPFPVMWCNSTSCAVLSDEKLCSRANCLEKLLSRTAVRVP